MKVKGPSVTGKVTSEVVKWMGIKKRQSASPEAVVERIRIKNEENKVEFPSGKDKNFFYSTEITDGKFRTLRVQKDEKPAEKAILYIHGGSYLYSIYESFVKDGKNLCKESGRDVWMPDYPLCIEYCITKIYDVVLDLYKQMLEVYDPKNISFIGYSAGAALALGVCCHINARKENIPMPGLIIAYSPCSLPYTEEEKKEALEISKVDVMIDGEFVNNHLRNILIRGNEDVPDYMIYTTLGDFTNFPPTHIYFGTHEILYSVRESFEKVLKKYNVDYQMHYAEGMFHCYVLFSMVYESRKASKELYKYLEQY
ncbi:hypothetical protein PIROE2DRAFT_17379 [Piromyces sp. E2]|nr:hypothetical protein PIROE2DRAFT_17379 [Piromyces sp. E2]|eukprot:OUM57587.1 hypothetical protein PIROE2DRAFT_17379 [Piromyces sp. E2]